jgi:hypothetical protein
MNVRPTLSRTGRLESRPYIVEAVLENATKIYELAALIEQHRIEKHALPQGRSAAEVVRAIGGGEGLQKHFAADPWGTPYRVTSASHYSIISAGPDRKFDDADDTRFDDGRFSRSHHDAAVAKARNSRRPDEISRQLELAKANRTLIVMRTLSTALAAYLAEFDQFPEGDVLAHPAFQGYAREDGWGTPLRVTAKGQTWRIVSAGADKTFDAGTDLGRDVVNENGRFLYTWESAADAIPSALARYERAKKEFDRVIAASPKPIAR